MHFVRICLLSLVVWLSSTSAYGQDIPYANYLVGDRALGLGGAFVGLADDGSASFHNPAGLTLVPETAITASFWVVGLQRSSLGDGWATAEGNTDFADTDWTFPPLVVTAVAQVGERDADGRSRHAIGGALLKPRRQKYRYTAVTDNGATELSALDVAHHDDARWYGLSYAYRPIYRLSFGASAFVALRDLSHEEFEVHDRDTPLPADISLSRHSVFHASLRDLIWRFGATFDPGRCWRFGVMFQLPGIGVGRSADNRELRLDLDAAGMTTAAQVQNENMRAFRNIPWELRVGGTWFWGSRALVTADFAVHGPVGSESSPVDMVIADIPEPRLLALHSYLSTSYRAALGAEYVHLERFPLRGGVLVYTSGAPDIPDVSDQAQDPDMTTVGASFSGGMLLDDGRQVSIGTALIYSRGTGSALDQATGGPSTYRATGTSDATILIFISGGVSGAKELAKTLAKRSEGWMDE